MRPSLGNCSKVEQFFDVILFHEGPLSRSYFEENVHKLCSQGNYKELPPPFRLKEEPTVPYSMQIIALPTTKPDGGADDAALEDRRFHHVLKHVYLHKNKLPGPRCAQLCAGEGCSLEWGSMCARACSL